MNDEDRCELGWVRKAMREVSDAEWERADRALEAVAGLGHLPDFKQEVKAVTGTSHRNVIRWAKKAELWPPQERDPLRAYRAHSAKGPPKDWRAGAGAVLRNCWKCRATGYETQIYPEGPAVTILCTRCDGEGRIIVEPDEAE